jgi:hypothetical protein
MPPLGALGQPQASGAKAGVAVLWISLDLFPRLGELKTLLHVLPFGTKLITEGHLSAARHSPGVSYFFSVTFQPEFNRDRCQNHFTESSSHRVPFFTCLSLSVHGSSLCRAPSIPRAQQSHPQSRENPSGALQSPSINTAPIQFDPSGFLSH